MAGRDVGAKCLSCGTARCSKPWFKWCANCWTPLPRVGPALSPGPTGQWKYGPPRSEAQQGARIKSGHSVAAGKAQ
eukprot:7720119-Pyramimonas_sp.AAC.1